MRLCAAVLGLLAACGAAAGTPDPIFADGFELAGGVVVPGSPGDPALTSLISFGPIASSAAAIREDVLLDRLTVILAPEATVGEVNAALASVGGLVVTMRPNRSMLTISVPQQADRPALLALAESLQTHRAFQYVMIQEPSSPNRLPSGPAGDIAHRDELLHLLPSRFPAAWNASALATRDCESRKVPMVINDFFHPRPHPRVTRLNEELPGLVVEYAPGAAEAYNEISNAFKDIHGYEVASTAVAAFDDQNPTGAMPFSQCVDLRGYSDIGLASADSILRSVESAREAANSSGKVVVNLSTGFYMPRCNSSGCTPEDVEFLLNSQFYRAINSLWLLAESQSFQSDVVFTQAAGNSRTLPSTAIYPGLGLASFGYYTSAAKFLAEHYFGSLDSNLGTWLLSPAWWDPADGYAQFPSLRLSNQRFEEVLAFRVALGLPESKVEAPIVIMAGATTASERREDIVESSYSSRFPDVHVPSDPIFTVSGRDALGGTSNAAPQVAGLVAYLWLLSPALRALDAEETEWVIEENLDRSVPGLAMIDAYAASLALDAADTLTPASAPVRVALLDVNNNGHFDEDDIEMYNQQLILPPTAPSERNYGRYDLNGDGYTGGTGKSRFDLDRIDSVQFGSTRYNDVDLTIDGTTVHYNESALSDRDILCYYAYSPLYVGDIADRDRYLRLACLPLPDLTIESDFRILRLEVVNGTVFGFSDQGSGPGVPFSTLDLQNASWRPLEYMYLRQVFTAPEFLRPDQRHMVAIVDVLGSRALGTRRYDARTHTWDPVAEVPLAVPEGFQLRLMSTDVRISADGSIKMAISARLYPTSGQPLTPASLYETDYDSATHQWSVPVLRASAPPYVPGTPTPLDLVNVQIGEGRDIFWVWGNFNTRQVIKRYSPESLDPVGEFVMEFSGTVPTRARLFSNGRNQFGYAVDRRSTTQSGITDGLVYRYDAQSAQWINTITADQTEFNPEFVIPPAHLDELGNLFILGSQPAGSQRPATAWVQGPPPLLQPSFAFEYGTPSNYALIQSRNTIDADGSMYVAQSDGRGLPEYPITGWVHTRGSDAWSKRFEIYADGNFKVVRAIAPLDDGSMLVSFSANYGSPQRTRYFTKLIH